MDTKLHIVATLDTSPGMEGAVHIEGEGIERIHYVEEEAAAELVKRWNAYPELVAKLRNLVDTIECQAESNFLNEDADDGETNDLTEARDLLQTLKA